MKKLLKSILFLVILGMVVGCSPNVEYVDEEHIFGDWIAGVKKTCTEDGIKGHYHCEHCGKDFDNYFNELYSLVDKCTGHTTVHTAGKAATALTPGNLDYYKCTVCGKYFADKECTQEINEGDIDLPVKVMTVKELMEDMDGYVDMANAVITVRAVVAGITSNADGGYIYYVLKDEHSNDIIVMRDTKEKDVADPNLASNCSKGYSYAPNDILPIGSIVEIPVCVSINDGSCGERRKRMLLWRGDKYDTCYNFGGTKEWREKYIVGYVNDYSIDHSKVTKTISSQEQLEAMLTGNAEFQNQIICFEGTAEKPLKFVTGTSSTNVQDLDREYLYIFYDNPTSINDAKVGNGNPVFSNFGNTFNMASPLSCLLCGQTEFEDPDFTKPYEFVGKIYAICVGGNNLLYHFVCLSENDIINTGNTGSHAVIADKYAKNTFFNAMEDKARELGIELQTDITTAIGIYHAVSIADMVRVGIALTKVPKCMDLWSNKEFTGSWINAKGQIESNSFPNAIWEKDETINLIQGVYGQDCVIGAKGGSLGYNDERKCEVLTNVMAVKGPNNETIIIGVNINAWDEQHESTSLKETAKLIEIMYKKIRGEDTASLEAKLDCVSCAAVVLPTTNVPENGYDWWGEESTCIHFGHNMDRPIITASIWKMMTCLTAVSNMQEEDYAKTLVVKATDLSTVVNAAWPKYSGGEVVSIEVALHSMMRRSSNNSPTITARAVGQLIVQRNLAAAGIV